MRIQKAIEHLKDRSRKSLVATAINVWAVKLAIEALEYQLNDKWMPASERLPEKDDTYLCTIDGEICGIEEPFTGTCYYENGKWDEEGYIIAWRPLPEPYQTVNKIVVGIDTGKTI